MTSGRVYTETVVHVAPSAFEKDAPYQVAIVTLDDGSRVTGRVLADRAGDRVSIDDAVALVETRDGVPFFRKSE
ncbi:MAG: Zn-ribbon domain-containing OB-fold protein [Bryobacteraceae bacterium]